MHEHRHNYHPTRIGHLQEDVAKAVASGRRIRSITLKLNYFLFRR
jgi:hypothetical protein